MTMTLGAIFGGWKVLLILAACLIFAFVAFACIAVVTWLLLKISRQNQRILEQNRKL
jgi:ABC-type uncharacterized transport system permease subunit